MPDDEVGGSETATTRSEDLDLDNVLSDSAGRADSIAASLKEEHGGILSNPVGRTNSRT